VLDYTLFVLGALLALAGVYFQLAPSDWWLAYVSEAYQYGSHTLGGLILEAGFGVYADRTLEEDGYRSTRVITGSTLASWPSSALLLPCCSGSSDGSKDAGVAMDAAPARL
jgi:hypothetical protein